MKYGCRNAVGREITIKREQYRKKTLTNVQNQYLKIKQIKSNNYFYRHKVKRFLTLWGRKREKTNIAIAILGIITNLMGQHKLFRILGAPIIYSPIVEQTVIELLWQNV